MIDKSKLTDCIAAMAVSANVIWGLSTDTVVNDLPFEKLSSSKQSSIKTALVHNKKLSAQECHKEWQKSAPSKHPSNIPYDELSIEVKAKDLIFKAHCELLGNLYSFIESNK